MVLRSKWNLNANRLGLVVEAVDGYDDRFLVLWTTKKGYELKIHITDALLPVTSVSVELIKERNCVFK